MAQRVAGEAELVGPKGFPLDYDALCFLLYEIQVCTGYKLNGSPVRYADVDAYGLETVELIYQTFPGWKEEISAARSFDDLPSNAQAYVKRIEEMAGVPVKWIGVGPEREATIRR